MLFSAITEHEKFCYFVQFFGVPVSLFFEKKKFRANRVKLLQN